ncbi:hypothetical protein HHI36_018564 [Cryptolaemus montrouzieri]|uniref:Uncharacterized protein n=1 Tax=Cryptolaemus montrouzieri TaxID=559131 RepID=A0ABD2P0G8_9CUCU
MKRKFCTVYNSQFIALLYELNRKGSSLQKNLEHTDPALRLSKNLCQTNGNIFPSITSVILNFIELLKCEVRFEYLINTLETLKIMKTSFAIPHYPVQLNSKYVSVY